MKPLGSLEPARLRDVWPDEARDFTPWLAQPENIQRLGEAIELELEVVHVEAAVGPFSADILARDVGSDLFVVIENQLNKTDHDHLGKTITYSATLGAKTIVWVAPHFTDEHRKALDWLNDNTVEDIGFFGVQVELWRIDDSKPAVRFNVISRPSELVRQAVSTAHGELTPVRQLQFEWWTAFREALLASGKVPTARAPRGQYWYDVTLGRSGAVLSLTANVDEGRIAVRLYLRGRMGAQAALDQLEQQRETIEKEIGAPLSWNPHPERRDKVVVLERKADLNRRDKWPEYLTWMVDATLKMRAAFAGRVRNIDFALQPDEAGDES